VVQPFPLDKTGAPRALASDNAHPLAGHDGALAALCWSFCLIFHRSNDSVLQILSSLTHVRFVFIVDGEGESQSLSLDDTLGAGLATLRTAGLIVHANFSAGHVLCSSLPPPGP
jgi:hypothetical protein